MPLYEYECDACGRRFERIQKFSDPPATSCPTCEGPVRRLLSAPAIQFKGSGFYITDYAKSGGAKSDDSGGTKPASDGGTTAAPTKPDAPSSTPATADAAPAAKTEASKAPAGSSAKNST